MSINKPATHVPGGPKKYNRLEVWLSTVFRTIAQFFVS